LAILYEVLIQENTYNISPEDVALGKPVWDVTSFKDLSSALETSPSVLC
jgi:hypothetical protein